MSNPPAMSYDNKIVNVFCHHYSCLVLHFISSTYAQRNQSGSNYSRTSNNTNMSEFATMTIPGNITNTIATLKPQNSCVVLKYGRIETVLDCIHVLILGT